MSTATGDGGSSPGGAAAVELEFENIDDAVGNMKKIADTISTLQSTFSTFADAVKPTDWSDEPSCQSFGSSYKAAVGVYTQVIAGMQKDLANYAAALASASKEYKESDANSADALAKLGAVDDGGLTQDTKGQGTYHDDKHHGELSSDKPEQATDTTPDNKSGDTKMPGANSGGSNAGQNTGGAGQSTQPQQNNGTSQGGPNGGNGAAPPPTLLPSADNSGSPLPTTVTSGASQGGTTR